MPKLSVIVPVYNVEAYLPACIDSILSQTLQDLELILIDDGSPDSCGIICDDYSERDKRIKVIHQSNSGVSNARNAGLKIATGDFVGFVDPDDMILQEMYLEMVHAAETTKSDIAICGFSYCAENGSIMRQEQISACTLTQREMILSMYGKPNQYYGSMCNKIFTRETIIGLFFDESVSIGEDWLLLYECYEKAKKAIVLSQCFYIIRLRSESATRKRNAQLYMKKLKTYDRLFEYAKDKDREIKKKASDKILDTYLTNKTAIVRDDYDKKCLRKLNRRMRHIAVSSFVHGNLPLKQMAFYVMRGFEY